MPQLSPPIQAGSSNKAAGKMEGTYLSDSTVTDYDTLDSLHDIRLLFVRVQSCLMFLIHRGQFIGNVLCFSSDRVDGARWCQTGVKLSMQ